MLALLYVSSLSPTTRLVRYLLLVSKLDRSNLIHPFELDIPMDSSRCVFQRLSKWYVVQQGWWEW